MTSDLECLGSIPRAVLSVSLLWCAAWTLGGVVVRSARIVRCPPIDHGLLRAVVGLNLLAWLGIMLGMSGALAADRTVWLVAGLCLPAAMEGWLKRRDVARVPTVLRMLRRRPWFVALIAGATLLTLGPALAYPTGWDELVYHNVLPRRWRVDGWPAFYPDLPYSGFPSACEILFWLIAPLESVIAPRLLIWTCWIVGLAAMARLILRKLDGLTTAALVSAFAVCPTTLMASANCYVESFLLLNVATVLLALGVKYRSSRVSLSLGAPEVLRAPPLLLGILAGGSAAVKLTGLSVLLLPLLWYTGGWLEKRVRTRRTLLGVAVFLVVAACVVVPFYARPGWTTGNPCYPYFAEWFSSSAAVNEMSRYHHDIGGAAYGLRSPVALPAGLVLLAFDSKLYDGSFGWQFLVFVGLAARTVVQTIGRRSVRGVAGWPALVFSVLYLFWIATAQQARFALPAVMPLVWLASFGARRTKNQEPRTKNQEPRTKNQEPRTKRVARGHRGCPCCCLGRRCSVCLGEQRGTTSARGRHLPGHGAGPDTSRMVRTTTMSRSCVRLPRRLPLTRSCC